LKKIEKNIPWNMNKKKDYSEEESLVRILGATPP
jgi:hypothetical protein